MMLRIRLNQEEKDALNSCYIDVGGDYVFVFGGSGNCEAAFPIRHWGKIKNHIDREIQKGKSHE